MTDHGLGLLASRLTDAIRAVRAWTSSASITSSASMPLIDLKEAPWPDRVTIDGHDALTLLKLIHEVRQLRDGHEAWKTILHRMEREVEQWRRRAETIRGLLDQANVDLHVDSEVERQARMEASS